MTDSRGKGRLGFCVGISHAMDDTRVNKTRLFSELTGIIL